MRRYLQKWLLTPVDFFLACAKELQPLLTPGRIIAMLALLVAMVGVQLQFFQLRSDLEGEVRTMTREGVREKMRQTKYLASLGIELQANHQAAKGALASYEKSKYVGVAPQYTSDVYKAGLVSGDVLFLKEKARRSIVSFYNFLPTYEAQIKDLDARLSEAQKALLECKLMGAICDNEDMALKSATDSRSLILNEFSRQFDEWLKEGLSQLAYEEGA